MFQGGAVNPVMDYGGCSIRCRDHHVDGPDEVRDGLRDEGFGPQRRHNGVS
jgi:hypothetical protein